MKKLFKISIFALIIFLSTTLLAQPPDPSGNPNNDGEDELGGNAPIGSGLVLLLSLGAAYGGRKVYVLRKIAGD